jgi:ATP-dependent DNA helicase RecG
MTIYTSEFGNWIQQLENTNLEFKEAKNSFSKDKDLPKYCCAISNEGGGKLILGVSDKLPRNIVGTSAFHYTHTTLPNFLRDKLGIRIEVEEKTFESKRILIFHIPKRFTGQTIKFQHIPWSRDGESIRAMTDLQLKEILNESESDFSFSLLPKLTISDLDKEAISNLKKFISLKSGRDEYRSFSDKKICEYADIFSGNNITYAGLILLGKKEKIDQYLPCSEIIFEWRQTNSQIHYDYRISWSGPFLKIYEDIWKTINSRNLRIPFQEGFLQREIYAFSEKPIREALINAVAHRDYTINSQSIFIKASPDLFEITSPGGLTYGITLNNILWNKAWRNRRLCETLQKTPLMERSGQGMDDIFQITIEEGKGEPRLSKSDKYSLVLEIPGKVQDKEFILFLEKIANEKQILFSFEEILELEQIRKNQIMSNSTYKEKFLKLGIIEGIGKTKGKKYLLAHRYYTQLGQKGTHTRIIGLERDQKKQLILNHLKKNKKGTSKEFQEALYCSQIEINNLLQELKKEGVVIFFGQRRWGHWKLSNNV